MSRRLNDPVTVGRVLSKYSALISEPSLFVKRLAVAEELLALGRRLDEPNITVNGLSQLLGLARESGDLALAEAYNAEFDAVIGDHPWPYRQLHSRSLRASRQYLAGDLVAAEVTAAPLLSLATDAGFGDVTWYAAQILPIRFVQGRLGELLPLLEQADLTLPGLPAYRVVLATALATSGRSDDARTIMTDLAANDYHLPHHNWFSGTVQLAEVADLLDDRAAAASIFERLQPFSGRIAVHGPGVSRPVDQALAQLSLILDDAQQAVTFASRAVKASRQRGTPVFLGRELVLLAAALRRAGHSTWTTTDLVSEALAIAGRTGAQLITHDAIRHHLASAATVGLRPS
jgi:hypothetical protein